MKRAVMVPYTFVLMNWAAVESFYQFIRRPNDTHKTIWTKRSGRAKCSHCSL